MWTEEEKTKLTELYPSHSIKELCEALSKTEGQIRGMKERLGLNEKFRPFTELEKSEIKEYYLSHQQSIDLSELEELLHRPRTSISRYANKIGLTKNNRPMTEQALSKKEISQAEYRNSERYNLFIKPKQVEILSYYARNNHPRGMLGKHHTEKTRAKMSATHREIWSKMDESSKKELAQKIIAGISASAGFHSSANTYSRCHGGYREDLGMYFRSSWEANVARFFSYMGLAWTYESQRFAFKNTDDGVRSYCPDFYLPDLDYWVEVKGWMDEKSLIRLRKFESEYPKEYSKLVLIDESVYMEIEKDFSCFIENFEFKRRNKNGKDFCYQ